jgi:hypothetical protein
MIFLKDRPRDAGWLTATEKDWLEGVLASEHELAPVPAMERKQGIFSSQLLLLASIWFLDNVGVYGFNLGCP